MADQQRPKAAAFDINRPRGVDAAKAVMFPTVPGGLPAIPPSMDGVDAYLAAMRASLGDVAKATQSSLMEAAKALGADVPQAFSYSSMSFMPDPGNYGLMQWPGLNPESLAKISRENLVPQVIVQQRVSDIARYAGLSTHSWKPGWRITLRDASETPTRQDKEDIKAAQRFLWNCNMEGMDPLERDSNLLHPFSWFLRSFAREALVYDGWSIWTDRDSQNRVRAFTNLPAGMIRLAVPTKGVGGNRNLFAALVDETGSPVKPFTRKEMTWNIRNVRLDPSVGNYGYPEIEMAVRLIQAFQSGVDLNADQFCYSSDTEVLTKGGWKRFDATDVNADEFATLRLSDGEFEYQKATDHTWVDYEGDAYTLESRSFDFLITPNHRVITQYRPAYLSQGKTDYTVTQAADLYAKLQGMTEASRRNICLPTTSAWKGVEIPEQVFGCNPPQYAVTARAISGDDYCALLGAYLAEGNLSNSGATKNKYIINIHQQEKSKGYSPFKTLLARIMGKNVVYTGDRFVFGWYGLADHLRQFGENCYSKMIPQSIMDATPRQQKIFWDYFILGDGSTTWSISKNSTRPHWQEHATTTSKRLADQLQELAQKMGYAATICTVDPRKYATRTDGRNIHGTTLRYDIYLKTSPMQSFDMVKTTYKGKIGCVSVPNGTLYVRRNGKAAWCGNTRNSIPNGMLLLKGDYWNQEQIDALMREWTNMKRGISKLWGMPVMAIPEESEVELMQFMDLKGTDVRFKDHMNMMMGVACLVWCFPIRRLGMFVSGHARDNQPVQDAAIEIQGADDPGLPPLLMHVEDVINPYLLWPRWPNLLFEFLNKNPKEDSRSFQERTKARTWKEARAETDLQPLPSLVKAEYKPMAEIMEMCPEDPGKAGVFQTLAVKMLEINAGAASGGSGGSQATPGARMTAQNDPAESQGHGHLGGVRRNSRAEKDSAAANKQENPA